MIRVKLNEAGIHYSVIDNIISLTFDNTRAYTTRYHDDAHREIFNILPLLIHRNSFSRLNDTLRYYGITHQLPAFSRFFEQVDYFFKLDVPEYVWLIHGDYNIIVVDNPDGTGCIIEITKHTDVIYTGIQICTEYQHNKNGYYKSNSIVRRIDELATSGLTVQELKVLLIAEFGEITEEIIV